MFIGCRLVAKWTATRTLGATLLVTYSIPGGAAARDRNYSLPRLDGTIAVDGSLSDRAWRGALRIDAFYEISPGDNAEPVVRTTAYVGYDSEFFYAAVHSRDPKPEKIRASYSDRDAVFGDQDFVQFDLDTKNDEKSSFIFRVNPRGVKADAIFSEATGLDDFSPDFSFEAQGRIVDDGWIAEFRVPLSSLRYTDSPEQTWGITFYRNYPRRFRRQMTSFPIPRGANCWLCYSLKLTGIRDLPPSRYTLFVPFATAASDSFRDSTSSSRHFDGGVDLKWIPQNDLTLDATYNPDFAQVEADVPQISVNRRFALFYPEKRSFFLEGADLLATPLAAVYTRSITSPAWGTRATGRAAAASYTLLVTKDGGGGTTVIPGPLSSRLAPQEGESLATVGRLRYSLGSSFAGIVFTDREWETAHNRVLGPDLLWRPTDSHQISAQLLLSSSRFVSENAANDSALSVGWQYSTPSRFIKATYERLGHEFRADNGFIPQVGVDRKSISAGYRFYPEGFLRLVQPAFTWDRTVEIADETVTGASYPSLLVQGRWNSALNLEYHLREQARVAAEVFEYDYLTFDFDVQPSHFLSTLSLSGNTGQRIDFVNARVGNGTSIGFTATLRPGIHLVADLHAERQWLNIRSKRLFTADAARLKLTYNFTSRTFLRSIGQYESIRRNPSLYSEQVEPHEGVFSGSVLYGYRFNWQTVFYAGFGQDREFLAGGVEERISHFFVKVAYAFEH